MAKYILTLDGGTTNTRVILWDENKTNLYMLKKEVGIKDSAKDGNNVFLINHIKSMLEELIQKNNLSWNEIDALYVCGMLTSNIGLKEVKHINTPVSYEDIIRGVQKTYFPEICPVPVYFVPGVKNSPNDLTLDNIDQMDMMRGEETETLALMDFYPKEDILFVLPGSHTKFVLVNNEQKIIGCLTSMTGEILSLLTRQSILADSVKKRFALENYNKEYLIAGANHTWKSGLTRSTFLVRIASQFLTKNNQFCADFLLGSILAEDITAIKHNSVFSLTGKEKVVIAGKEPFRKALRDLFIEDGFFQDIEVFRNDTTGFLSGYGLYKISEYFWNK